MTGNDLEVIERAGAAIAMHSGRCLKLIRTGFIRSRCAIRATARRRSISRRTFLKLLKNIGDFRGDSSFETWLYRMVVNRCLDTSGAAAGGSAMVEGFFERPVEPGALHELLRSKIEEHVQRVVAMLPPEQRVVVVLRYTEGLSYAEIAEIAGCSEGTVASRLSRAHKFLERRLAKLRGRS